MEAVEVLADGDVGVRACGASEWINQFYDFVEDDGPWDWRACSTLTTREVEVLESVLGLMNAACDATPQMVTDDQLIESGWPHRVQPVASAALALMRSRGRFSEEAEEVEPGLNM